MDRVSFALEKVFQYGTVKTHSSYINMSKEVKQNTEYFIVNMDPSHLTRHNLWDGQWLEKRYPERFDAFNPIIYVH